MVAEACPETFPAASNASTAKEYERPHERPVTE
jgi:hypothetical protein